MSGSHTVTPYGADVSDVPPQRGHTPLGVRLRAFVMRAKLDSLIAGGTDPSSSPELALRAAQLASTRSRRRYARSLHRVLAAAEERPRGLYGAEVAVNRREILAARSGMLALAEALEAPDPVAARGVAIAAALLRDGNGPLYAHVEDGALSMQLRAALDALRAPRPSESRR